MAAIRAVRGERVTDKNLSHWDFATEFTAKEAAALIVGLDPVDVPVRGDAYLLISEPVLQRIADAATEGYAQAIFCEPVPAHALTTNVAEKVMASPDGAPPKASIRSMIFGDERELKIKRSEILRWLNAIGTKSVYQFDLKSAPVESMPSGNRWPWGQHSTNLLDSLEKAARRFWVNYDPSDATTAPTNEAVSTWLQSECKLSRKMGDAIASILRADGLATGPRK